MGLKIFTAIENKERIRPLIYELRERFKIDESYTTYLFEHEKRLFKSIIQKCEEVQVDYIGAEPGNTKIETTYKIGVFKHNGDYIMSFYDDSNFYFVVFSKDLSQYDEFIEGKEYLENGVFKIKKGIGGTTLSKHELFDNTRPYLNDNLFNKIYSEIQNFIDKKEFYKENNLIYKRGIMLYGEPGCGKTMFINYLANNIKAMTILCNCKDSQDLDFIEDFISSNKYSKLLKIIVLEDIDGVGEYHRSIILNMLDGLLPMENVIFVSTTNFLHELDVAISNRPSRFDSLYHVEKPNDKSRKKLITHFFKDLKPKQLKEAVEESDGFKGSYFKELFIISKFNDCSILKAIEILKERFEVLKKSKQNYSG